MLCRSLFPLLISVSPYLNQTTQPNQNHGGGVTGNTILTLFNAIITHLDGIMSALFGSVLRDLFFFLKKGPNILFRQRQLEINACLKYKPASIKASSPNTV